MDTRWVTVDGVYMQLPADAAVDSLRNALHKPADAELIAVTDDVVSVVHAEETPLSSLVAGSADRYHFHRDADPIGDEILAAPELEYAIENPNGEETTFQRPGIDH